MTKNILNLLCALVICTAFSSGCSEDAESSGSLKVNLTNCNVSGTFLAGVYDFADISVSDRNPIASNMVQTDTSKATVSFTIDDIEKETVYLAILLDTNFNLTPNPGERYTLYNGKSEGENADPITIKKGKTTTVDIDYTTFATF